MSAMDWCTVESDPGIFTSLIEKFGVEGIEVQECWALDDDFLATLGEVHGFIFLFKYKQGLMRPDKPALSFASAPHVFFANQVINNACATQAILAILLNAKGVRLGDKLSNFREFTASLPPDMKGLAISNSEDIRAAHNSFARAEPFLAEKVKAKEDDDVFHFVAYVPIDGQVYELDGLQSGPIHLGPVEAGEPHRGDWLKAVRPLIQARMAKYGESETKFNLMALTQDRREVLRAEREAAVAGGAGADGAALADIDARLAAEDAKREKWAEDDARRKHNYIPFIVQLLRCIARKQQLESAVESAKERQLEKRKSEEAEKQEKKAS